MLTEEEQAQELIETFAVRGYAAMCVKEILKVMRYAHDSKINYWKKVLDIIENP